MLRFFVPQIHSGTVTLSEKQHRHSHVRRAQMGATVELLDGQGNIYQTRIASIDTKKTRLDILSHEYFPKKKDRTLYVAICRNKTTDIICQKAAEFGITALQPLTTDHIGTCPTAQQWQKKSERLIDIMQQATCQARNPYCPQLLPLSSIKNLQVSNLLIADPQATTTEYQEQDILIGPEGGFSQKEQQHLLAQNAKTIRFPGFTLRSETAAIYAMGLMTQN